MVCRECWHIILLIIIIIIVIVIVIIIIIIMIIIIIIIILLWRFIHSGNLNTKCLNFSSLPPVYNNMITRHVNI